MVVYAVGCALLGLFLESFPDYVSMFSFFGLFIMHLAFIASVSRTLDARVTKAERIENA